MDNLNKLEIKVHPVNNGILVKTPEGWYCYPNVPQAIAKISDILSDAIAKARGPNGR